LPPISRQQTFSVEELQQQRRDNQTTAGVNMAPKVKAERQKHRGCWPTKLVNTKAALDTARSIVDDLTEQRKIDEQYADNIKKLRAAVIMDGGASSEVKTVLARAVKKRKKRKRRNNDDGNDDDNDNGDDDDDDDDNSDRSRAASKKKKAKTVVPTQPELQAALRAARMQRFGTMNDVRADNVASPAGAVFASSSSSSSAMRTSEML
jgi:hypothetical protein